MLLMTVVVYGYIEPSLKHFFICLVYSYCNFNDSLADNRLTVYRPPRVRIGYVGGLQFYSMV